MITGGQEIRRKSEQEIRRSGGQEVRRIKRTGDREIR
jgi:hypothetical protein